MNNFYNDLLKLTDSIERQWQKVNYSTDEFHKVAWEQTNNADLSPLAEVSNQLTLLEHPSVRSTQIRSTFSDFYFQLFNNGHFLIEILNWWGGHVNVHDHDFSAVQFQLKGDALNVVYDFEEDADPRRGALRFGELKVRNAEIWKEGTRSMVRPGNLDVHSVFHLGNPTTSLLIRTVPTPRYGAQSNYFPSLAANYHVNNDIQRKKLTALALLASNSTKDFQLQTQRCVDTQSLSENFFMFLKLGPTTFRKENVQLVYDYAKRGEEEARIIKNVAYNNAIDFFKTKANQIIDVSESEKLAIFSIAGSHGAKNFEKIKHDLKTAGCELNPRKHLESFMAKLSDTDKNMANQYLDLLQLSGIKND